MERVAYRFAGGWLVGAWLGAWRAFNWPAYRYMRFSRPQLVALVGVGTGPNF